MSLPEYQQEIETTERRIYPRFDVRLSGAFTGDYASTRGMVLDISAVGCKFQSEVEVASGSHVAFTVLLPGHDLPLTVDLAVVRWCAGATMGIGFMRMAPGQQALLHRFINRLLKLSEMSYGGAPSNHP